MAERGVSRQKMPEDVRAPKDSFSFTLPVLDPAPPQVSLKITLEVQMLPPKL